MKVFTVSVPVFGSQTFDVEANSPEDARSKAMNDGSVAPVDQDIEQDWSQSTVLVNGALTLANAQEHIWNSGFVGFPHDLDEASELAFDILEEARKAR